MKEAMKEYFDLCGLSLKWMKKHWKGYLLVCMMIYLIEMIIFFPEYIIKLKNWIVGKFKRKKSEEAE